MGERTLRVPPHHQTRGAAMARTGKLTAIEVAKAKGPAVLHDGGGLYLRVTPTGAKSWVFRFQLEGGRRDMGLGLSQMSHLPTREPRRQSIGRSAGRARTRWKLSKLSST